MSITIRTCSFTFHPHTEPDSFQLNYVNWNKFKLIFTITRSPCKTWAVECGYNWFKNIPSHKFYLFLNECGKWSARVISCTHLPFQWQNCIWLQNERTKRKFRGKKINKITTITIFHEKIYIMRLGIAIHRQSNRVYLFIYVTNSADEHVLVRSPINNYNNNETIIIIFRPLEWVCLHDDYSEKSGS